MCDLLNKFLKDAGMRRIYAWNKLNDADSERLYIRNVSCVEHAALSSKEVGAFITFIKESPVLGWTVVHDRWPKEHVATFKTNVVVEQSDKNRNEYLEHCVCVSSERTHFLDKFICYQSEKKSLD